MASNVTGLVANAKGLTPTEKLVLFIMAEYSNAEGGSIYPSQKTIAIKSGLSRKTVNRTLSKLNERGVITQLEKRAARGQHFYKINLDALEPITIKHPVNQYEAKEDPAQMLPKFTPERKNKRPKTGGIVLPTVTPENQNNTPKEPENSPENSPDVTLSYRGMLPTVTQTYLINNRRLKDLKDLNNYRQKYKKNYRQNAEKNESGTYPEKQVKSPEVKTQNGEIPKPPNYELFKAGFDRNSKIAKTYPWGVMQVRDFIDLVNEFNANRVTAEDFSNAVKNQDANGGYENTSSPKSYRKRAYSEREKRLTGRYPNPASDKHPANRVNQSLSGIGWKADRTPPIIDDPQLLPDPIDDQLLEIAASYDTPEIEPAPYPEPPINPQLLELTNQAITAMEKATGQPYELRPADNDTLKLWLRLGVTGEDISDFISGELSPKYLYLMQKDIINIVSNFKPSNTPQPITAPTPEAVIDPIPSPAEAERERLETNNRLELAEMIRQFRESKKPAPVEVMA